MAHEQDHAEMIERLERELRHAPSAVDLLGLNSNEFEAGCRHLLGQGLNIEEIGEVFDASPSRVRAALGRGPRLNVLSLGVAAALVLLAGAGAWLVFGRESKPAFVVEVAAEILRSPGTSRVGASFSLFLRRLPRASHLFVARIRPDLSVAIDFPFGAMQARHLFAEGDIVPGASSGVLREFAAGPERGRLTLIVAMRELPFTETTDGVSPARLAPPDGTWQKDDGADRRERLTLAIVQEIRRRGADDVQVLEIEVVD